MFQFDFIPTTFTFPMFNPTTFTFPILNPTTVTFPMLNPTTFTFPMFDPKTFTIFNNLGAAIKGLCTAAAPNRTPRQGTLAESFWFLDMY